MAKPNSLLHIPCNPFDGKPTFTGKKLSGYTIGTESGQAVIAQLIYPFGNSVFKVWLKSGDVTDTDGIIIEFRDPQRGV